MGCALALFSCGSSTALASSLLRLPSESDALRSADVVLVGTVTSIRSLQRDGDASLVTEIGLTVERRVKGESADQEVLVERGGQLGNRVEWIAGSPEYDLGERVLVHASRLPGGALRTWGMAVGRAAVRADGPGRLRVRLATGPRSREVSLRHVERRAARLGLTARRAPASSDDGSATAPGLARASATTRAPVASQSLTTFRFLTPAQRWSQTVVPIWMSPGGHPVFGRDASRAMLERIAASWNAKLGGTIRVEYAGESEEVWQGCSLPGIAVLWDFTDADYPATESCDALASRPPAFTPVCGTLTDIPGTGLRETTNAYVVVPHRRLDCRFYELDAEKYTEALTHEVGHALGLAHSCEQFECAPSETYRLDATMNFSMHLDLRDAALRAYDADAIGALYDVGTGPAATATATPTATPRPTVTPRPTGTPAPTWTAPPEPTRTATPAPTRTAPPAPTRTATPVATRTVTPVATRTPAATPPRIATPTPTATPAPTATSRPTTVASPGNRETVVLLRTDVKLEETARTPGQARLSAILEMAAPPPGSLPRSISVSMSDGPVALELTFPESTRRSVFADRTARFASNGWTASWSRSGARSRIVVSGVTGQTSVAASLRVAGRTDLSGGETVAPCTRRSSLGRRTVTTLCQRSTSTLVRR